MSADQDAFLKDLQNQCLQDAKEHLESFMMAVNDIPSKTAEAMTTIAKCVHSLKGNVQAAGFTQLGNFLHEFETILSQIEQGCQQQRVLIDDEKAVFEFLLSDVHFNLNEYVESLQQDFSDSPGKRSSKQLCLQNLEFWWKSILESKPVAGVAAVAAVEQSPAPPQETVVETKPTGPLPMAEPASEVLLHSYLLCRVGQRHYGIEVESIVEVINNLPVTPLPEKRPDIRGLINLRGETISVLNMNQILGATAEGNYLVVCQLEGLSFGFEVDEAEQIITVHQTQMRELNPGGLASSHREAITSVVPWSSSQAERDVLIVNLRTVLAA